MPRVLLMGLAVVVLHCRDYPLGYIESESQFNAVDNLLTISGEFCTSPAASVEYPVKVLFIVDGSGSQQFSDQNRQRVVAVEETINALIGLGNTYFKVVVFNAAVSAVPAKNDCNVFTRDNAAITLALNNLAEADSLTDYQGALAVAYEELQRDMSLVVLGRDGQDPCGPHSASTAELGRTKYVVIFISDGMPDPQCTIGLGNDFQPGVTPPVPYLLCESENFINCVLKRDLNLPGGTVCDAGSYGTCDSGAVGCAYNDSTPYCCDQGDQAALLFGGTDSSELSGGNDYNQPYQILQKVEAIMELKERYQVGELRIHSGLVLDPFVSPDVIGLFGDPAQAAPLMRQVAETGGGNYMEFYGGDSIDFLQINFEAIKQHRVIRGFFAENRSLRLLLDGHVPDTDYDGITDQEEFVAGTDPRYADTDGDGYRDMVEMKMLGFSFDPNDHCYPPINDIFGAYLPRFGVCDPATDDVGVTIFPCTGEPDGACGRGDGVCSELGFADLDRDGLHDCEERALGTDPDSPDTDGDGIPDLQEVIYNLDPKRWDFDSDADKDGLSNGQEVEWQLNPQVRQDEMITRESSFRYDRPEIGKTVDGRTCYAFTVKRVALGYTQDSYDLPAGLGQGINEIRLYILENMSDNLSGTPLIRTACVRAQYVPPNLKIPQSGKVNLTEADFRYLGNNEAQFNEATTPGIQFDPYDNCQLQQ